jgi:NAD(P)H-flavin reductase
MALQSDPDFAASGRRVHLVYGARQIQDLIYFDGLRMLAESAGWLDFHPVVVEGAPGSGVEVGTEQDILAALAETWRPFTPLVCGVREFTFPTRAFFIDQMGFERRSVKVENYNGPTAR